MEKDYLEIHSEELRKMPFNIPEGYFEETRTEIMSKTSGHASKGLWSKVAPYASMAAAFILMVTGGRYLLEKSTESDSMTYEDYVVHSEYHISTEYSTKEDSLEVVEDEDIINYLIYSGITAEVLELSK